MSDWLIGIAIATIIFLGVIVAVQLIAITVLFVTIKNLVQQMREHLDPLISKTNALLLTANEMAQTVQDKTEHIADTTAHTTDVVAGQVEKTTGLLQRVISYPIIQGMAAAAGIRSGASTWREARARHKH